MRWHCLWKLARGIKALPDYCDASKPEDLEPVLRAWHRRSASAVRTKDIRVSRRDLWEAYKRVRFPGGIGGRLASMVDVRFGAEPLAIRIDRLCAALQDAAGDEPFFAACRSVAEVLGSSHVAVSRILKDMRDTGVLQLVTPGMRRRAAEYRYRGGVS